MFKSIILLALFFISNIGTAQLNDTIYYRSGMEKVVEISDFTAKQIKFKKVNSKGDTVDSQVGRNVVSYFVIYDEEGILQFDSRGTKEESANPNIRINYRYPSAVSVSKHQFSINPFYLPLLSLNAKYNYRFGKKMQYSICSRATYLSPIIDDAALWGNVIIGTGFQFTPFYNDNFSFGIDFVPLVGFYTDFLYDATLMLPLSLDFDFYLNETIGFSVDLGVGQLYGADPFPILMRGHLGVLFQFKDKKTFDTGYR